MSVKLQGNKVVGAKQTTKVIKNGSAVTVYLAKDAEIKVTKPIEELCSEHVVECIYVNTMKELGHMCGIEVGAATAAVIK